MLGEILVLRPPRLAASGPAPACSATASSVRRDGRLAWADALRLDGDYGPVLDSRAGFGGAAACATFVYAGPDAADLLDPARELLADDRRPRRRHRASTASWSPACLRTTRLPLRRAFALFWAGFRARRGRPPAPPAALVAGLRTRCT